jgi:cytochrome bd ubiquinol oxidase subunit I
MDPLQLARLQFATTASIHFLFVVLTLGLVTLVVALQTAWLVTKKPVYQRLTRFWGLLYVINYILGIATGVVMEFQFGLNWSGLSKYLGNVFGAPLAIETLVAFFLESTFLGMWIFGWHRLSRGVHTALIWLVALTAYASAFWVLVANAFLQNPVGYEMRAGWGGGVMDEHGVARLTDFGALLRNPALWMAFAHVCAAALTTGGFVMAGVSAWHFIRRTSEHELFRKSLRLGLVVGVVGAVFVIGFGFAQFAPLDKVQPTKFSADTAEAAALVAQWQERFGPGDYAHPQWIGQPLTLMMLIAFLLFFAGLLIPLFFRDWIIRLRVPLYLLLIAVPLPFAAAICGWLVREVGRQPWVAYGLLPTADAVSPASGGTMLASYIGFTVVVGALAIADWVLLAKYANRGPDVDLGRPPEAAPAEPTPVLIGG